MSGQETESLSERQLAENLRERLFSGEPQSVGEALKAATTEVLPGDDPTPPIDAPPGQAGDELRPDPDKTPPQPDPIDAPPIVVTDEPGRDRKEDTPAPPVAADPGLEPGEEATEEDIEEAHLAWAKKKYGDDPDKWAKAAFDQEQHISRISNEKREAEQIAAQWYEYAQQVEQQASQQTSMGMPMSAAEENWVEQSLANPLEYARQAAYQGNGNLYNAVLGRVAEENPMLAAQIGTVIQTEMQQAAQQQAMQQNGMQQPTLQQALGSSFQRLGIDLEKSGPQMMEKVSELGEYHPYVQAILEGDDRQRDLAVQAVYDLVRAGTLTKRRIADDQRAEQIKREGELRREAAGVVTGSPHIAPAAEDDPWMSAMRQEWRDRRQWGEE